MKRDLLGIFDKFQDTRI